MINKIFSFLVLVFGFVACSSDSEGGGEMPIEDIEVSLDKLTFGGEDNLNASFTVECSREWTAYSNESWIACAVSGSTVNVTVSKNDKYEERTGSVIVKAGSTRQSIPVTQAAKPEMETGEIVVPEGYRLVWHDEFDDKSSTMPNEDNWYYEVHGPGWVNNELQTYIAGKQGDIQTAEVSRGTLKIHAIKDGNSVYSARLNSRGGDGKNGKGWKYGYFEASLKLPKGKGTWPAFWMMPVASSNWPDCGEIDIMEEVGCVPNEVSSSIHCKAYYHAINTQKTAKKTLAGAQDEFHTYALEWDETEIKTYVDGELLFRYKPEDYGARNEQTWPFNKEFEVKLNLAWGGDWGGMMGVDESCLPATYEIDYVRVFQKK
ncbi:MAG: family 16 glycosylhydrolase [Bacteroides sp.]|nr:family 16 glycosylhydrolase [Bacteroides sp.]